VRARLGVTVNDALVYATGGFAYGRTSGGIENSVQQGSGNVTGYAVGAGINYAFTQNWIATGEFMHVDLGDIKFGTGEGSNEFLGSGSFNTVRAGFAYKF
jgi:outer membrane immunogenic protein